MAKSDSIHVTVITPEKAVLDVTTDSLIVPAHDGQLGALFNRASLMCQLGAGELKYRKDGKFQSLTIHGGFAQIHRNEAIVLTERADEPAQ